MKARRAPYLLATLAGLVVVSALLAVYLYRSYVAPYLPPIREGPSLGQIAEGLRAGLSPEEVKARHGAPCSDSGNLVNRAGVAVRVLTYYDAREPESFLSMRFARGSLATWETVTDVARAQDKRLSSARSVREVEIGWSPEEVENLLGRPGGITTYITYPGRKSRTSWIYDCAEDPNRYLWLQFRGGKLTHKSVESSGQR
jgi:hypothetical protein